MGSRGRQKGNASATATVATLYKGGYNVEKDEKKAAQWYSRRPPSRATSCVMNDLAFMLANGRGVEKDEKKAAQWYQKAADKGDDAAMADLGILDQRGLGVVKDEKRAAELYREGR